MRDTRSFRLAVTIVLCSPPIGAQQEIPYGSKVFIAPMGGFETYLRSALDKKKVPLTVVDDRDSADFEISGVAESHPASTAKKVITGSWHSIEEASIKVTSLKTGVIVFAYSAFKPNSTHGRRSTAEACAKHLKERVTAR